MPETETDTARIEHSEPRRHNRNEGIDFVRGSLILLMIFHHCAVFSPGDHLVIYLRDHVFTVASGGFVFMAGMSIRKYAFSSFGANRLKGSKELILRGLQLILIFCVAVVAGHLFSIIPPPQGFIREYLIRVFIVSYPQGVPYEVLLGIGYLFLISPLVLSLFPHRTWTVVMVLLALSAATAGGYRVGQNAWIVLCGLWGMTLTHVVLDSFGAQNRSVLLRLPRMWSLGAFLVAAYTYAAMGVPKENIIVYALYVTSFLTMLYHMFVKSPSSWKHASGTQMICEAGRRSLWWYVVHVPVVVFLNHNINLGGGVISFVVGFLIVVGVTAALISVIHFFWGRVTALQYM
jgi:hypothetical protein